MRRAIVFANQRLRISLDGDLRICTWKKRPELLHWAGRPGPRPRFRFARPAWYFQRLTSKLNDPLLQRNHASISTLVLRGRVGAAHWRRGAGRERQRLDERGAARR